MNFLHKFIELDYWVQVILGVFICLTVWFFVGLWLLIPFGAWQVFSGIFLGFGLKDWRRIYYLAGVVIFFSFSYFISYYDWEDPLSIAASVAAVLGLGISYFRLTKKDYEELKKSTKKDRLVLDDLIETEEELTLTQDQKLMQSRSNFQPL